MAKQAKKTQKKSSNLAGAIVIFILIGLAIAAIIYAIIIAVNKPNEDPLSPSPDNPNQPTAYQISEDGVEYAVFYDSEAAEPYDNQIIENTDEYFELFGATSETYNEEFFAQYRLISVVAEQGYCGGSIDKVYINKVEKNGTALAIAELNGSCGPCAPEYHVYTIALSKEFQPETVEYKSEVVNEYHCEPGVSYKPVIYLYPTAPTEVNVKVEKADSLIVSYPTYQAKGWTVKAMPNGDLTDLNTGRGLYSLYYEADDYATNGIRDEGFVVKGGDTVKFLEEKLAKLGLSDHEAEEFIVYWLPQMQNNAYNYVYFELTDEVDAKMPLDVTPAPATKIRLIMEFKALDAPIQVKEQKLPTTPERKGFTLVEWGGTIL